MKRSRYFLWMSTIFFAVVMIGFARSFYLRTHFDFPELRVHLYVHGVALTAWFALALIQPWLIESGRITLHRRLGIVGVSLAIGVVITGLWTLALRDAPVIDDFPTKGAGNLASLLMFSACVTLGVLFRRKPITHKRLMLLASIPILAPALDRLARFPSFNELLGQFLGWFPAPPEVAFASLSFLFLLSSVVINDLVSTRRVQSGTVWGLFSILIIAPVATYGFMVSGVWVTFVHWVG